MFPLMNKCSDKLVEYVINKSEFELKSTYGQYTMVRLGQTREVLQKLSDAKLQDVIASSCFATNTNPYQADENNVFVDHALAFFRVPMYRTFAFLLMPASRLCVT